MTAIERLEYVFIDQLQSVFPVRPSQPDDQVIIADIDEKSLTALGQFPWPRSIYGDLINQLRDGGVRVIGFDIVFAEQDRNGVENDLALATAIEGENVVLAWVLNPLGERRPATDVLSSPHIRFPDWYASVPHTPDDFGATGELPPLIKNIDVLERAASGGGTILTLNGVDGVTRGLPLVVNAGGELQPAFALEMVRVARKHDQVMVVPGEQGIESIKFRDGGVVPLSRSGEMFLHFPPTHAERFVSVVDILDGTIDLSIFNNKIVIVGTSAAGLKDEIFTPLGEAVPGVVAHATAIEQMLSGQSLYRPAYLVGAELVFMVVMGVVLIVCFALTRTLKALIVFVLLETCLVSLAAWLFAVPGLVAYPVYPASMLAVIFAVLTLLRTVQLERQG